MSYDAIQRQDNEGCEIQMAQQEIKVMELKNSSESLAIRCLLVWSLILFTSGFFVYVLIKFMCILPVCLPICLPVCFSGLFTRGEEAEDWIHILCALGGK